MARTKRKGKRDNQDGDEEKKPNDKKQEEHEDKEKTDAPALKRKRKDMEVHAQAAKTKQTQGSTSTKKVDDRKDGSGGSSSSDDDTKDYEAQARGKNKIKNKKKHVEDEDNQTDDTQKKKKKQKQMKAKRVQEEETEKEDDEELKDDKMIDADDSSNEEEEEEEGGEEEEAGEKMESGGEGEGEAEGELGASLTELKTALMPKVGKKQISHPVKSILPDWTARTISIDLDATAPLASCPYPLDPSLLESLQENGITELFAVQHAVVPAVMKGIHDPLGPFGGDVCVAAPTGSGKTLAYAIPVCHALVNRVVCRLRALIILPTRDLALQVKDVFDSLCTYNDLKVGLALGQVSFSAEQKALVGESHLNRGIDSADGHSLVDILVTTPGRLIDHMRKTKGFTLQHLRFLVIDEADRLLSQSYQDWVSKVLQAVDEKHNPVLRQVTPCGPYDLQPVSWHSKEQDSVSKDSWMSVGVALGSATLKKMLFSATMTTNPQKLTSLSLNRPLFFAAASSDGRYVTPVQLEQYMIECDLGHKPLILLHLISKLKQAKEEASVVANQNQEKKKKQKKNKKSSVPVSTARCICFTASVESTHRLARLFELYGAGITVAEYSSTLSQEVRHEILGDFKDGKVDMLVCSDAMARGIDVLDVDHVVNYDVPVFIKTYIHRVGRTARAGRAGSTYTLLRPQEMRHFKQMVKKIENSQIKRFKVEKADLQPFVKRYKKVLPLLKVVLTRERSNLLSKEEPLPVGPFTIDDEEDIDSDIGEEEEDDDDDEATYDDNETVGSTSGAARVDSKSRRVSTLASALNLKEQLRSVWTATKSHA